MRGSRRVRAWDEFVVGRWGSHDAKKLQSWAESNGWSYQAEEPALVGVYLPRRPGAAAHCFNVLTSTVNGRPVRALEYASFEGQRRSDGADGIECALVVIGLPGLPPADVVQQGLGSAITRMGGSVPSNAEVYLCGTEMVVRREGVLEPRKLVTDADLMTRQINAMPPSFWRTDL
jgi:hypothetical protein